MASRRPLPLLSRKATPLTLAYPSPWAAAMGQIPPGKDISKQASKVNALIKIQLIELR